MVRGGTFFADNRMLDKPEVNPMLTPPAQHQATESGLVKQTHMKEAWREDCSTVVTLKTLVFKLICQTMIPLFNLFNDGMFKADSSLLKNFLSTSLSFGWLLLYGLPIEPTIRVIHIKLDSHIHNVYPIHGLVECMCIEHVCIYDGTVSYTHLTLPTILLV